MKYYRVPAALDQRKLYKPGPGPCQPNGWFLIGGELLTLSECKRRNAPVDLLQPVEVSKAHTYRFFGARFPTCAVFVAPIDPN